MIRVLGCSGSIAARCHTTSFLLDDDILIDAGTGVGELRLDELARIDHILISHSHLDHVLSIPLLADSVIKLRMGGGGPTALRPIHVHALPETLQALRAHLFNGVIWPDFTRLPSVQHPILVFHELAVGDVLSFPARGALPERVVHVLPAAHTVPGVGFGVETPLGWWVFTGDTGPNPALWEVLAGQKIAPHVTKMVSLAFGLTFLADAFRYKSDNSGVVLCNMLANTCGMSRLVGYSGAGTTPAFKWGAAPDLGFLTTDFQTGAVPRS